MTECARCGAATDESSPGEYHYCVDCRDRFAAIERDGVVVEDRAEGDVGVLVTASEAPVDGSIEDRLVEGLARGTLVADETGVDALFVDEATDARWLADAYLDAHPDLRERVDERRAEMDGPESEGLLQRLRTLF